jgi:catecholate siderophore receptor
VTGDSTRRATGDTTAQPLSSVQVIGVPRTYRPLALRSITRTATPIERIPQAVTVITRAVIDDQAMTGLGDLVRYVPGVTMAQGEGHRDAPVLRGNLTTADFFVDGLRDDLQYLRDLYNVERVDVIQGPAALTLGRGTGGGAFNRVTKTADGQRVRSLDLVRDSYGQGRIAGDLGYAIDERVAVRLNAVSEESGTFRDAMTISRRGLAPAIGIRLGASTRLEVSGELFRDDRGVDRGVPSLDGLPWRGATGTFFGNPEWSRSAIDVATGRAELTHQLRAGVAVRSVVSYGNYGKFYDNVFAGGAVSSQGTVAIAAYTSATDRANLLAQTDLVWEPTIVGRRHTLLIGIEGGRQQSENRRINTTGGTFSLADRGRRFVPDFSRTPAIDNANALALFAVVAQDQVQLTERLTALAGLRWERYALAVDDRRAGSRDVDRTDAMLSPRIGLVWAAGPTLSFYGGWTTSALPQSGEQFSTLDLTRAGLEPERFENLEVGARWQATKGLLVSTALYRLDRTNTTAPGALPGTVVLTGAQRAEGLELSVQGEVTSRWRMIGALALQDARITATTSAAPAGRRAPLVPRTSVSLWNRMLLSPRVSAALGIVHQGDQYASITNAVTLPAYTRVDGGLFLTLTESLRVQFNAENLTGTRYWFSAHNDNNLSPGAPTLLRTSLTLRF